MVAGQYITSDNEQFNELSTGVRNKYAPREREKTIQRPEGNWGSLNVEGNPNGLILPHVVERRLQSQDVDIPKSLLPYASHPHELLSRSMPIKLSPQQLYCVFGKQRTIWLCGGVGCGKTFVGSIFAYLQIIYNPQSLGLIGANSNNQLNQSTLKPFMEFLDSLGVPYEINKQPPPHWGLPRLFKDYESIMTFPNGCHILLRTLEKPGNLEGLCFHPDTWVRMDNGGCRKIKNIVVGDRIKGPDGPKTVTKMSKGFGPLFWIRPKYFSNSGHDIWGCLKLGAVQKQGGCLNKGWGFICNGCHILVLRNRVTGELKDIPLDEYQSKLEEYQQDWQYVWEDGTTADFNVLSIGDGDYVGLLLDGADGRLVLGDGTIAHNTLGWYWIDETRHTKQRAFDVITARLRCPKTNWLAGRITSTGNGHDWLFKIMDKGMKEHPHLYKILYMSSRENPHLPDGFIAQQELLYDDILARQEIDGRIISTQVGRSYHQFSELLNVVSKWDYDPRLPLYFCWDFNASIMPMACVIAQERYNEKMRWSEIQVLDEVVIQHSNVEEVCNELIARYQGHRAGVHIFGDRSGHDGASKSDYETIKQILDPIFPYLQFKQQHDKNPDQLDRIASVNAMLKNNLHHRRLFIHPKCHQIIEDFKRVKPDPNRGNRLSKKQDPMLTHASDALGYMIFRLFPAVRKDFRSWTPGTTRNQILLR